MHTSQDPWSKLHQEAERYRTASDDDADAWLGRRSRIIGGGDEIAVEMPSVSPLAGTLRRALEVYATTLSGALNPADPDVYGDRWALEELGRIDVLMTGLRMRPEATPTRGWAPPPHGAGTAWLTFEAAGGRRDLDFAEVE